MSETGEILFRPTCSKCGTVLHCDIKYGDMFNRGVGVFDTSITPNMCPNCGCFFECVCLPSANNSNTFYYSDDIYGIAKGKYYG